MHLSRGRQLLMGLLVLGLMILVIDKVFLGTDSPGSVNASAGTPPIQPGTNVVVQTATPVTESVATRPVCGSIAQQLGAVADRMELDTEVLRDAFVPFSGWVESGAGLVAMPPVNKALEVAEKFQRDHHLMAILAHGGKRVVVIEGQQLAVGDTLDGFELVNMGAKSALFSSDSARVVLTLRKDR